MSGGKCATDETVARAEDLKDQDVWDLNRAKELWKLGNSNK